MCRFTFTSPFIYVLFIAMLALPLTARAGGMVTNCSNDLDLTAKLANGGTVTFNCGAAAIILGNTKTIAANTTVDGGGKITLSGGNAVRLFTVNAGSRLTLKNITVSNGFSNSDGGAIYNAGTLVLSGTRFLNNRATASGGAIVSYGPLTISSSEFGFNRGANGGALYPRFGNAVTTISNSRLHHNQTTSATDGWGGAILAWDGAKVTMTGGQIDHNKATYGGAIYVRGATTALKLNNVLVAANITIGDGGGIYNHLGTAELLGVTLQGNKAGSRFGGAIYTAGFVLLTNSTLSSNSARSGAGIYTYDGGRATLLNATVAKNNSTSIGALAIGLPSRDIIGLKNTVLAENRGGNCLNLAPSIDAILSSGFNVSDDASCSSRLIAAGDLNNTPALLNPLANNGGPTPTYLPKPASPAINGATVAGAPAKDQRGYKRPQGAAPDIGAVEACAAKPGIPKLISPANGAVVGNKVPLNWSDVPCGALYQVQARLGSPTGALKYSAKGLIPSQITISPLAAGQTYAWRVLSCNEKGCTSSMWRNFRVK